MSRVCCHKRRSLSNIVNQCSGASAQAWGTLVVCISLRNPCRMHFDTNMPQVQWYNQFMRAAIRLTWPAMTQNTYLLLWCMFTVSHCIQYQMMLFAQCLCWSWYLAVHPTQTPHQIWLNPQQLLILCSMPCFASQEALSASSTAFYWECSTSYLETWCQNRSPCTTSELGCLWCRHAARSLCDPKERLHTHTRGKCKQSYLCTCKMQQPSSSVCCWAILFFRYCSWVCYAWSLRHVIQASMSCIMCSTT